MKDKNKLRMMDAVDDELIDRANPEKIKPRQKRKFSARMGMLAACLVIAVVAVNLAIFLPSGSQEPPIIPNGDGSVPSKTPSTYEEIKAILDAYDDIMEGTGTVNSNAQVNGSTPDGALPPPGGAPSMGDTDMDEGSGSGEYVEVTDNQVQGVIEADLFKRTSTHIFYLRGRKLCAYTIDKESSRLVGEIEFTTDSFNSREMYLSSDAKTAIIIYTVYTSATSETRVTSIDISKPDNMKAIKTNSFKGKYLSSRYTKGELLLFTDFRVKNTAREENYIPSIDTGNGFELLDPECILVPQSINNRSYVTISKLTGKSLSFGGSVALLGYNTTSYVSEENIYAVRSFRHNSTTNNVYSYADKTEIARIDYSEDTLKIAGTVSINGSVKDQYCMDEYNGVLRVFTTVREGYYPVNNNSGNSSSSAMSSGNFGTPDSELPTPPLTPDSNPGWATSSVQDTTVSSNDWASSSIEMVAPQSNDLVVEPMSFTTRKNTVSASLYCIDIENMQIVASVLEFAPQGETVQSARFDGNTAYVCTAIVFTDPVFVFDLSDLENITYKDTGTIEGYSHSLIELKGGYLLGIGQTGWSTVKLELYKETEAGLSSVSKLELENAYSTTDYKAHYVNREELVFGFAYAQYGESSITVYSVFKIVEGEITVAEEIDIDEKCAFAFCRGVLVDNYFYVLTDNTEGDNFFAVQIA